jgi:hypothetical protein
MSDLFPETIGDASLDDQLKEIDRELAMRERLYPQWVARGTLRQSTADRQIAIMKAVHETVRKARQEKQMTSALTGKRIDQ